MQITELYIEKVNILQNVTIFKVVFLLQCIIRKVKWEYFSLRKRIQEMINCGILKKLSYAKLFHLFRIYVVFIKVNNVKCLI